MASAAPLAAPAAPVDHAAGGEATLFRLALALAPYALVLLAVLHPGIDWDVWWHLRTGQWVVEHGTVPTTDPFTAHGPQTPWVAYSWLFEVMLYGLHAALGLGGVLLYQVVLALLVTAALHRLVARREPHFLRAVGLICVAVIALSLLLQQRSWLFSILFTTLTLDVILDLRRGRRNGFVWLLPVVYVLWASTHIQFVYGLALLALAAVLPFPPHPYPSPPRGEGFCYIPLSPRGRGVGVRGRRPLVLLTLLCAVATLVNPYHVRLYAVVWEYATQPGPYQFVNELKAPEFRDVTSWAALALMAAALFTLGRRSQLDPFAVLILGGAAVLAFRARRDLWLLVLASTAVLASTRRPCPAAERFAWTARRVLALTAMVLILAVLLWRMRGLDEGRLRAAVRERFPVEAAGVVRQGGDAGPLYNDFNWGGYLIWALPGHRACIDGRTNLHGDERLRRSFATWAGLPGWENDPDLASARWVIAPADSPLAALLAHDRRFVRVHEDAVAVVFRRDREPAGGEEASSGKGRP